MRVFVRAANLRDARVGVTDTEEIHMQPHTETGTGGPSFAPTNDTSGRKGFFAALFDLSFRHFVTGRVVSFLYVVSLIFAVLNALFSAGYISVLLGAFLSAVAGSSAMGWIVGVILFLISAPLFLLVSIVYVRVLLEIVVVLFRISDNTAETARLLGETTPATPSRPAERSQA